MIRLVAHIAEEAFCAAVLASVLLFLTAQLTKPRRPRIPRHVDLGACLATVQQVETQRQAGA